MYVRKPTNKVRLNASRTSKTRVSRLGTFWRRNELTTLTLPKSGVARTVCYVNRFVQPAANTKTCLPINNYGECRKAPFNLFSATANRRKRLNKSKSLLRIAKGGKIFFSIPANRKVGLIFFFAYGEMQQKVLCFFTRLRRIRTNTPSPPPSYYGEKNRPQQIKNACGEKCCTPKIVCCAARNQPRGGCCAGRLF